MSRCEDCIHSEVCAELENYRDPLWFTNTKDEFCCSSYLPADVAPRAESEKLKADTAKAIFEEIDEGFDKIAIVATNDPEYCGFDGVCRQVFEAVDDVLAELKKKYTEGRNER